MLYFVCDKRTKVYPIKIKITSLSWMMSSFDWEGYWIPPTLLLSWPSLFVCTVSCFSARDAGSFDDVLRNERQLELHLSVGHIGHGRHRHDGHQFHWNVHERRNNIGVIIVINSSSSSWSSSSSSLSSSSSSIHHHHHHRRRCHHHHVPTHSRYLIGG